MQAGPRSRNAPGHAGERNPSVDRPGRTYHDSRNRPDTRAVRMLAFGAAGTAFGASPTIRRGRSPSSSSVAAGSQADQFARLIADPLQQKARQAGGDREPAGRRPGHRHQRRGQGRARRLHAGARQSVRPHHLAAASRPGALQHAAGFRADRAHAVGPIGAGGRSQAADPQRRRADRLRQGQSRQAQLRLARRGLVHPRLDRTVQGHHRHRHGARAVQRRRTARGRLPVRPGAGGDLRPGQHPASTSRPARRA